MGRTEHFNAGAGRPLPAIAQGAADYAAQHGMRPPPTHGFTVAHPAMTKQLAHAYDALPSHQASAEPAFKAMGHETERQFDFLTRPRKRGGLGVNVEVTEHDPYDGPASMMRDLHENNRLRVMSTATTGGHAFFSNANNDQFRAVHDAFGHAGTGRGFDRHGEEAAWQKHSAMYTPLARRAMTSETRGQNSSMITSGGTFPEQKVALLPAEYADPARRVLGQRTAARAAAFHQAVQFHTQAFGTAV